jgi:Polysaccharide pyruvyl transferase
MEATATQTRCHGAVISGSFGLGNLGDEALLTAFECRHRSEYRSTLILRAGPSDGTERADTELQLPRLATGLRFWRGRSDRSQKRRFIEARSPDGSREYIWLGGLLSHISQHNQARHKELLWASSFCSRFLYYFGDVGDGFAELPIARKIVRLLDRMDARIAVRSTEAARILEKAGLRTKVHVGLDPVLYDRITRWGIPFRRRAGATDTMAIIPCNYRPDIYQAVWLAAARAAVRHGLRLRWVSLCDPEDMELCVRLADRMRIEQPNHAQEICCGPSAEEALSQAACCVATRYHGAIFALSHGVPTLGVPYTHKVRRLFHLLRMQDWLIESGESQAFEGDLADKIRELLAGHGRPDYAALRQQAEMHRRALISLGATYPETIPTIETPVAAAG